MNVYDQAHTLARTIRESDEFREYEKLRERAYSDDTNRALLDEYKRTQFKMQARIASGERMDEEEFQKMQKIASLLQFNPDASAYLMSEFRFQKMLADVYKIIADVAGIDLEKLLNQ